MTAANPARPRRARRILIGFAIAATTVGLLIAAGLILLPNLLADFPVTRYGEPTRLVLQDEAGTASVEAQAGFAKLGLVDQPGRARLLTPDGRSRSELSIRTADRDPEVMGLDELQKVEFEPSAGDEVAWSTETLPSGFEATHTTVRAGGSDLILAVVTDPDARRDTGVAVVIRTSVPEGEADRYRTVAADLAMSVEAAQ